MSLNNKIKQSGFTIVELLIVIVVIGILAAITIVAYNGIQTRANNTSAATAAENAAKKIESFNSVTSGYPVSGTSITTQLNSANNVEANLTGSGITFSSTLPTGTARTNTVKVQLCFASATPASGTASRGYKVFRYDFGTNNWAAAADQTGGDSSANCFDSTQNVTQ